MISRLTISTDLLKATVEKIALGASAASDSFRWIRLEGNGSQVHFYSNTAYLDTEIALQDVSAHQPFRFEVSGPLFKNLVSLLPDGITEITCGDGVVIRSGKSEFKLSPRNEDLPIRRVDLSSLKTMSFDLGNLFKSLGKVSYAAAESSPNSSRVYTEAVIVWGPKLYATNGFRMAVFPNLEINHASPILLRASMIPVLSKIYKGVGTIGSLAITESTLVMSCGGITTSLRLMNGGALPNFEAVIPNASGISFKVGRDDLINAVSRCLVVADQKSPQTRLMLDSGRMVLESESAGNVTRDEVECSYVGNSQNMLINTNYLLQAVKAVNDNTGSAILCFHGQEQPLVVTDSQGEHVNVIVPLKL